MFTPARTSDRNHCPKVGLLKAACLSLVSVVLLTPSIQAKATGTAANDLVKLINAYRQQKKLPAIPVSQKLTKVAIAHMEDLVNNKPHTTLTNFI